VATEKRELILDLLSRNKMGPGTTGAARDIDKVGTAADAASKKTRALGEAGDKAEAQMEDLGDSSSGAARKIDKLDGEIRKVNQDLVLLAGQLADADSAAARLDISKGIRKSQADLKRLTSAKGVLEGLLPDPAPAVRTFATKLSAGLTSAGAGIATKAGASMGPTIGLAIAAAAAPVLVSGLAGALSAGAGALGLGAGIALAVSNDKEIQQAGVQAGKKFTEGLSKAAVDSYKQPIMESIGLLSRAGDRISRDWAAVFRDTYGLVVPFVQQIVGAAETISGALAGAARKSGPALDAVGDSIGFVADAGAHLIDTLADGSPQAADNLRLIVGALTDVVNMSTNFLGVLNKLSSNPWMTGPLLPMLRKHYADAGAETGTLTKHTAGLATTMTAAARAARGERDALVELSNEMKAQTDPAFALIEAQDKVRASQKNLNKAVKEHGKNSGEARQASRDLARAAVDLQAKAGALGGAFNGKLTPAMRNTLEAAGLTKGQIRGVEREFKRAKAAGDRFARNYAAKATLTTVYKTIRSTNNENSPGPGSAIRDRRASGGPITRGTPYLVGEHGPEIVVPSAAGRVLSAAASRGVARSAQLMGPAGGGGHQGDQGPTRIEFVGEAKVVAFVRSLIRNNNLLQEGA
jgi:hypothetical protein